MTKTLVQAAAETIAFLAEQKLLTEKDSLSVQIIHELCAEWPLATTSTQRAALSKEIRNSLASLPQPVESSDPVDDVLTGIANA